MHLESRRRLSSFLPVRARLRATDVLEGSQERCVGRAAQTCAFNSAARGTGSVDRIWASVCARPECSFIGVGLGGRNEQEWNGSEARDWLNHFSTSRKRTVLDSSVFHSAISDERWLQMVNSSSRSERYSHNSRRQYRFSVTLSGWPGKEWQRGGSESSRRLGARRWLVFEPSGRL